MQEDTPLWVPDEKRIGQSLLRSFMEATAAHSGLPVFPDYRTLYQWSIAEKEQFWTLIWKFCRVIGERGERVLINEDKMETTRWFPDARLNFAENLLRPRDEKSGVFAKIENGEVDKRSFAQLYREVAALSAWLRKVGVRRGDRVAGCLPNIPETMIAMLATTSLGAVWTATSPDFGTDSIVERFGQTAPKVLFGVTGYLYNGRWHDCTAKIAGVAGQIASLQHTVVIDRGGRDGPGLALPWHEVLTTTNDGAIVFERCSFNDPLYILYSSGTTGKPKCIVHGIGGTLLQHLKEHQLHCDIHPGDRVFYFTTCGWMMWNWLVSVLASGAAPVLFDGSPFHPDPTVLWSYAEETGMTLFGTSAKYLDALKKQSLEPGTTFDLSALRTVCSTGSVLVPESFDYVYRSIKQDICLASISGGTDIVSCFVLGCPILPVYRGECQCRGLGMAVEVFDESGSPVVGEKGELVCTASFPSQPLGFWGDEDGRSYHQTYFSTFPGVWHHGDFVKLTRRDTVVLYGRSDTTLNPGGVRIGTAEIYRAVEQLEEVIESLAIGQQWQGDTRIILFVVLHPSLALTEKLREKIRLTLRSACSPRHLPSKIIQIDAVPRTKSGKIVELAVRETVHGRPVKNIGALANPEVMEQFKDHPELRD